MAREERTSRTWMSMVTVLWVVFGLVVVGLVLWYGGIIGGQGGGGNDVVTQEDSAQNGNDDEADQDGNGNGEDTDVTADDNGNDQNGEEQTVSVFTAEQADRGQEAYSQNCAECHGGQLDGTPPLTGDAFASTWEGMPVNALYEVISQTMPQDSPGSLDEETYNDVTAHILAFNGMPDGDSELQAGEAESMETLISFDGTTDDNGDAQAEGEENGDAQAEGDANGDAQAEGDENGDTQADDEAGNGDEQAADDGEQADGADDQAAENGEEAEDTGEAEAESIELEDTADGQPGAGEGWIDLTVEPESATVNVLGPTGYVGQLQGGEGTITGLDPGNYVFTASLGNFSHRVDAQVLQHETVTVNLLIAELAGSPDLAGGQQDGQNGQQNGAESDETSANGEEADTDQNGNGQNGDNGQDDANGNGDDSEAANGNGNGDDSESANGNGNGDDAWYTDDQAEAGSEDYSASCASCHGEDGTGGSDPPLADGALEGSFETVWDLFDYTSTEMPDDDPGALDEETYVNIIAHLLAINDYPSGDEELEADEDQMSDMSLSNGDGAANGGNGNGEGANGEGEDAGNGDTADTNGENGEDTGEETSNGEEAESTDGTSAERGASMYASNCAMCHGQTLHGVDAPPLAGPGFMARWEGHPVDWLYFQAHTSMPPDTPGSLDDQAYVDIMVYILSENGILEGDEEFVPDDLLLRSLIIGTGEQQDTTLESRIDALRRTVHDPFEEAESEDPEVGADTIGIPRSPVPFGDSDQTADEATENGANDNGMSDPANGENGDGQENGDNGESDENGGDETGGDFVDDMVTEDDSETPPTGAEDIGDVEDGGDGGNGE